MTKLSEFDIKSVIEAANREPFIMRSSLDLPSNVTFGTEIEFTGALYDNIEENIINKQKSAKDNQKWTLHDDVSVILNDNGIIYGGELISPILHDKIEVWKDLKRKCELLKKYNATTGARTSAHVHVGSQTLGNNPQNIRIFLKYWELYEKVIYRFSYGESEIGRPNIKTFANPIGMKLQLMRNSNNKVYQDNPTYYDWFQLFKKQHKKTCGLDFHRFIGPEEDEYNTVEFRCANGTLNPVIWQNNINLYTKLMLASNIHDCDEEYLDYALNNKRWSDYSIDTFSELNMEQAIHLTDNIFDNDKDKLLFLKQYIKSDLQKVKIK